MKFNFVILMLAVTLLTACARSPGYLSAGENTYARSMVGDFFTFSGRKVADRLEQESTQFCRDKGMGYKKISLSHQNSGPGTYASANITFKCEKE